MPTTHRKRGGAAVTAALALAGAAAFALPGTAVAEQPEPQQPPVAQQVETMCTPATNHVPYYTLPTIDSLVKGYANPGDQFRVGDQDLENPWIKGTRSSEAESGWLQTKDLQCWQTA